MRCIAVAAAILSAAMTAQSQDASWRSEGPFLASATDVTIDPTRLETVYLATANGGVFRSDDGGRTWMLPGTELTSRAIKWVEADPASPNTVWAGEDDPGNPAVWKSTDRGATWKLVTDSYKGEMMSLHPVGWRIAFAPSKPTDIWVPSTNLNYRSRDGGKTWTDFRVPGQDVYVMAVDPTNPAIVWAGGTGDRHHLSRSDDGGRTWKAVGKGLDQRVKLLVPDSGKPASLYAVTGCCNLYKSVDRGESFSTMTSPVSGTDDILRLVIEPGASRTIWAVTEDGLFTSADGQEWSRRDRGTGRYVPSSVALHPKDPKVVMAAGGGRGVYRSGDGGNTWSLSNAGLAAGWIERLYAQPGAAAVFARTNVGTFRRDGAGTWIELSSPFVAGDDEVELDGFLFDTTPGSVWAFNTADAWRSVDGGRSFKPLAFKRSLTSVDRVGFRSLAQHAQNPKVLWAGNWTSRSPGTAVYKTTDGGRDWKPSGKGLPAEAVTMLRSAMPDEVIALVGRRELFASRDGGATWGRIGRGLPDTDVLEIAVGSTDPSRVFVAAGEALFRSEDRGVSFTRVGGALDKEDVRAVAIAPDGRVFAGSFHGVFASADSGATWSEFPGNLPNRDVRALAVGGAGELRLWAGIAGGSVWSTPLPK